MVIIFYLLFIGQKRRLSLGVALISRPELLMLDEPTSGLDASSALGIMKLVSTLAAQKSIAILCTIHQPSSEIWNLFDKLCLMVKGEQVKSIEYVMLILFISGIWLNLINDLSN